KLKGGLIITHGDIAVHPGLKNADPCTSRQCKWPRSSDGKVKVPFVISPQYSYFDRLSSVQWNPSKSQPVSSLYLGPMKNTSLIYCATLQWVAGVEGRIFPYNAMAVFTITSSSMSFCMLWALIMSIIMSRSDRDNHVRILLQNVINDEVDNFDIVNTNNLNTPYDYNSVMQYERYAFTRNGMETIVLIPDNNVSIGRATEMSRNDILRVNRLYCS
ncbi:low choriolytic enzyme-like isoform X2, partial [Tachysurus ichikawai]